MAWRGNMAHEIFEEIIFASLELNDVIVSTKTMILNFYNFVYICVKPLFFYKKIN